MRPLKKQRLSEMVAESIKELIERKKLKPGDKIPSENELSAMLEVSRSSVREAVKTLEVGGILNVKQGKGIYIADRMEKEFSELKQWFDQNRESLFEHFEIRLLIEPHAAELAARNADPKIISKMKNAYEDFLSKKRKNDIPGIIKADAHFHNLISKAAGNRTLEVVMDTMTGVLTEGWKSSLNTPGRIESTVSEHSDIIDAIEKGDEKAAGRAMTRHLKEALRAVKEYYRKNPGGQEQK